MRQAHLPRPAAPRLTQGAASAKSPPNPAIARFQNHADRSAAVQRLHNLTVGAPHPILQRIGLEELVMASGSLSKLREDMEGQFELWPTLAKDLITASEAKGQKIEGGLMVCGDLTIPGPEEAFDEAEFKPGSGVIPAPLRTRLQVFLLSFMKANGQLDYIHQQAWFKDKSWKAVLEVNFYPDRAFNEGMNYLGAHKDTDSRNLFVNLIFNNPTPIPATEWTLDDIDPDPQRMEELKRLLPKAELDKILEIKRKIRESEEPAAGKGVIEGGVVGENAFVSWIDEAVWHATPAPNNRQRFQKKVVVDYLNGAGNDDRYIPHFQKQYFAKVTKQQLAELIERKTQARMVNSGEDKATARQKIIADIKSNQQRYAIHQSKLAAANSDRYVAEALLIIFKSKPEAFSGHPVPVDLPAAVALAKNLAKPSEEPWTSIRANVLKEIDAIDWTEEKRTGYFGAVEVRKPDMSLGPTRQVRTGIGGRPRANSDPGTLKAVRDAITEMKRFAAEKKTKAESGAAGAPVDAKEELPKRSFIRTWVTLVKNEG